MQSNAINLLCNISQKTQFLENWTFKTFKQSQPRKRSKTLHDLSNNQNDIFRNKNTLPKFTHQNQVDLSVNPIIFLDEAIKLQKRARKKQNSCMRIVKHKMHHKKILQSFAQRHGSLEGTAYNTVNLYQAVKVNSPQVQIKQQEVCAFSNSKISQSFHAAQSLSTIIKRPTFLKKHNRYFQSCLISAQILKRRQQQGSNGPLQIKKVRSDFKSKMNNRNNFKYNSSNGIKKYSLNIECD